MNRHRELLFHFAFRVVRDETAARDVVQESFVRAYFGAAKFKPKATVKTWLYAIALNLSRDHVRRLAKRRGEISLDHESGAAAAKPAVTDTAPLASDIAGQMDDFAVLQRGIDQLPEKLREALIVFAIDGKSQHEAAGILGTTPKTVELRVYRAKAKLRAWLTNSGRAEDLLRDRPPLKR